MRGTMLPAWAAHEGMGVNGGCGHHFDPDPYSTQPILNHWPPPCPFRCTEPSQACQSHLNPHLWSTPDPRPPRRRAMCCSLFECLDHRRKMYSGALWSREDDRCEHDVRSGMNPCSQDEQSTYRRVTIDKLTVGTPFQRPPPSRRGMDLYRLRSLCRRSAAGECFSHVCPMPHVPNPACPPPDWGPSRLSS